MNTETPDTVTATISGRSRKLRASCDRCSASKIKCGQERPACQRCVNSNRPCNYSVSRRLGKPAASDRRRPSTPAYRSSRNTSRNTLSPNSFDPDSDQSEAGGSDHPMRANSHGFNLHSLPTNDQGLANYVYSSTLSTPHLEMDLDQLFDYQGLQKHNQLDSLNTLHGSMPGSCDGIDLSDLQATDMHLSDELMLLYQSGTDNQTSSITSDAVSSIAERQPVIFAATTSTLHQPQMRPPINELNSMGQTADTGMSCATLAHRVLNSLSKYSTFCSAQTLNAPIKVDEALTTSKQANVAFHRLVACSGCCTSQNLLSLVIIIYKILNCYAAIVQKIVKPETRSSSPRAVDVCMNAAPISIGAYQVDAEDEDRFKMQLVSNELRKVSRSIQTLISRFSDLSNKSAAGSFMDGDFDESGSDLCHVLENMLSIKLKRLTRAVSLALRQSD
ncbi:hypothetical protein D6C78_09215 [Aureobasidium pullulans]|uniref:Zn(2)-C6 fungal-type domain-containing protein n=1 Tax=Aureobasidium pullulans TaxID=5580 RepID=A0A4V4LD74_AURPU|nr:hypothetical protein D6C78_09215 [Aureobasidium pullulans]